jgi:putative hydrolase of the HAD superfamily
VRREAAGVRSNNPSQAIHSLLITHHASPVWLFDLDNTLHNATPHIFPHINEAMRRYVARALAVDDDNADRIRFDYWMRYGATLSGMMRHHGTDPHHFLDHTHRFPDLQSMVVFDRPVKSMLKKLPGRKIIFSNAPRKYAETVLQVMGIRSSFDALWAIEHLRFRPKPLMAAFRRVLNVENLDPARCIMVEDTAENLRSAKRLGMRTVLISRASQVPDYVDLRLQSVLNLPRHLGKLK